jgi:hypothetical protein
MALSKLVAYYLGKLQDIVGEYQTGAISTQDEHRAWVQRVAEALVSRISFVNRLLISLFRSVCIAVPTKATFRWRPARR